MAQGVLPFKYEEDKNNAGITALGSLPVHLDVAHIESCSFQKTGDECRHGVMKLSRYSFNNLLAFYKYSSITQARQKSSHY